MESKQVLDVQQMQHLQELGLDTSNASMVWCKCDGEKEYSHLLPKDEDVFERCLAVKYIPAYTLQDVLDALPEKQHITFKSNNEDVTELCDLALSKNTVWYECDIRQPGIILDY